MKYVSRRLLAGVLFYFAAFSGAHASETDAFTFRYKEISDSSSIISDQINERITEVLDRMKGKGCDEKLLFRRLSRQLRFPVYGRIEAWIKNHPRLVPHAQEKRSESVYQDIRMNEAFPIFLGKMGFGPVLRVNGQLIGNDKLGHFLDEGYHYYDLVVLQKRPIEDALQYGVDTENGVFGLRQTGVHSYADTVANFNGMNFWARILGKPVWGEGEAYIACENGRFTQKVRFNLNEYVDAGWDEGVNCSDYRNESYRNRVMSIVQRLESRDQRPYACPIAAQACLGLTQKYGDYGKTLLHPLCRSAAETVTF